MPEPYRLKVTGPAARALEKVPERFAAAVVEFRTGRLLENPQRIGKPLLGRTASAHRRGRDASQAGGAGSNPAAPTYAARPLVNQGEPARHGISCFPDRGSYELLC